MKLYSILFFLAAILKFSDSCLVIRYSEPPTCACKTLKLDSSNVNENQVKENALYDFVLSSEIKSPEILIDDCSVQVYCEDGSELYIFDTDKGAKLGDYSLDGFCDPYQQKWQVDTGNGIEQYKELKGICVLKPKVECLPTDPATYLFAYSNDLVYSDIENAMYVLDNTIPDFPTRFVQAATVRFDIKTKEDIVFHEGDTLADSYMNSREHMKEQQVDPSQRFESSETGSDVLDMLERFMNTNRSNICGSFALIYMKRNPNEVEISKIVEKLRMYHIQFSIAAVHPSSGGLHPETLYDLAAKTNGFCTFSNDEYALFVNPHVIWPNLYYALNLKVSGTGKMVLPPITFPKQLYMMPLLVVGVQRTATAESFQSLTISSYDTQSGEIVPITVTKEQLKPTQDNSFNSFRGWFFMSGFPTTYNITLEYSYAMEDIIQIRITSTTPNDHWLPYQDV